MKYLILRNDINDDEVKHRQGYIREVFGVYTQPKLYERFCVLESVLTTNVDIILFVGHCNIIDDYIGENYNKIVEKIVVIDSCYIHKIKNLKKLINKDIYISKNFNKENKCHNDYGFGFYATDSEVLLYRNKDSDILTNLSNIYIKISDIWKGKKTWKN